MKRILAGAALALLTACAQHAASPAATSPSQAPIPTDGVHIDGAIRAVYPLSSGGTCNLATVNSDFVLQFSPHARTGAAVGIEIIKYTGPATYSKVGWPPYDRSAFWVGLIGGKTWRADPGVITVTSAAGGKITGTLRASNMGEVNGTTTVNASGSWTCTIPSPSAGTTS